MSSSFISDISSVSYHDEVYDEGRHRSRGGDMNVTRESWENEWMTQQRRSMRDREGSRGPRETRSKRKNGEEILSKGIPSSKKIFDMSRRRLEVWLESMEFSQQASASTSKRSLSAKKKWRGGRTQRKNVKRPTKLDRTGSSSRNNSASKKSSESWTRKIGSRSIFANKKANMVVGTRPGVVTYSAGPTHMAERSKTPFQIKKDLDRHPAHWTHSLRSAKKPTRTNRWYAREAASVRAHSLDIERKCEDLRERVRASQELCARQNRIASDIAKVIQEVNELVSKQSLRAKAVQKQRLANQENNVADEKSAGKVSSNPMKSYLDAITTSAFNDAQRKAAAKRRLADPVMSPEERAMTNLLDFCKTASVHSEEKEEDEVSTTLKTTTRESPGGWSIFDMHHARNKAMPSAAAPVAVESGLSSGAISNVDIGDVTRRSIMTVNDDEVPPGLTVRPFHDSEEEEEGEKEAPELSHGASNNGKVPSTGHGVAASLRSKALQKYARDRKNDHATKLGTGDFKPSDFFARPLRHGIFFRRAQRRKSQSHLAPRMVHVAISAGELGNVVTKSSDIDEGRVDEEKKDGSHEEDRLEVGGERRDDVSSSLPPSKTTTTSSLLDIPTMSSANPCEDIARAVANGARTLGPKDVRSFFETFASAVHAPEILKTTGVTDAFVDAMLGEDTSFDCKDFGSRLLDMFGGLFNSIQRRQCFEMATSFGGTRTLVPSIAVSYDAHSTINLSSFDFLVMHMKLFVPTCDALARAVEPAKESGLTGRLSRADISAFCMKRAIACSRAKTMSASEDATLLRGSSDERRLSTRSASASEIEPLNASGWCSKYGLHFDEEDDSVSVDDLSSALRVDADLGTSPCLLHALTWEYGIYVEDMLKSVVVAERKRQQAHGNEPVAVGEGRRFAESVAFSLAGKSAPPGIAFGETEGELKWISPDQLVAFCRSCLAATVATGSNEQAAVRQLPSLFLRMCRLGCADDVRGISVPMFARALEALFGEDPSQIRQMAVAVGVSLDVLEKDRGEEDEAFVTGAGKVAEGDDEGGKGRCTSR